MLKTTESNLYAQMNINSQMPIMMPDSLIATNFFPAHTLNGKIYLENMDGTFQLAAISYYNGRSDKELKTHWNRRLLVDEQCIYRLSYTPKHFSPFAYCLMKANEYFFMQIINSCIF